jgi:CBS domain-containing protein
MGRAPARAHVAQVMVSAFSSQSRAEYIGSGQSVENAARRMRDRQLRFLPVCKPDGRVVGIITERDIVVRAVAAGRAPELCAVDEVMTRAVPGDGTLTTVPAIGGMLERESGPVVLVDDRGHLVATVGQSILDGASVRTRALRQPPAPAKGAALV